MASEVRFFRVSRWNGRGRDKCLASYLLDDLYPLRNGMSYRAAWEWAHRHAILNPGLPYVAFELGEDDKLWVLPVRKGKNMSADYILKLWAQGYQVVRGGTLYVLARRPVRSRYV